jgi:hypothetical protein
MLRTPFGPSPHGRETEWAPSPTSWRLGDGTATDPPAFRTAVPNWRPGDPIPIKPRRTLRVIGVRLANGDDDQRVLVVEEV